MREGIVKKTAGRRRPSHMVFEAVNTPTNYLKGVSETILVVHTTKTSF